MPLEWIDVLDTTIKISLGSSIVGVIGYYTSKTASQYEIRKIVLDKNITTIQEISYDATEYFRALRLYLSKARALAKKRAFDEESEVTVDDKAKRAIRADLDNLMESWSNSQSAISKLYLINAPRSAKRLKRIKKLESEIRMAIISDKTFPSVSHIRSIQRKFNFQSEKFHKELAEVYSGTMNNEKNGR